jgi:hypothetical protein
MRKISLIVAYSAVSEIGGALRRNSHLHSALFSSEVGYSISGKGPASCCVVPRYGEVTTARPKWNIHLTSW